MPVLLFHVMIQMLHKDTAGRKSKFLKSNLLFKRKEKERRKGKTEYVITL